MTLKPYYIHIVGAFFLLAGCFTDPQLPSALPLLDTKDYHQALKYMRQGLSLFKKGNKKIAREFFLNATLSLKKFLAQNSEFEMLYGNSGLNFLVADLTLEEQELYCNFINNKDKAVQNLKNDHPDRLATPDKPKSFTFLSGKKSPIKAENADYIQNFQKYLSGRLDTFNKNFSGRIGLVVRILDNNVTLFDEKADECFVPASLTKLLLCSALIETLRGPGGNLDPEISFQIETEKLNGKNPILNIQLGELFRKINHYSSFEAPKANQAAEDAASFFAIINSGEEGKLRNPGDLFLNHLDQISEIQECSHIDAVSGRSLNNWLTPAQIADCMLYLKDYSFFINSLTIPGEGTLKNRLLDISNDNCFKTGSMRRSGVLCLAGYLHQQNQQKKSLYFVIMLNGVSDKFDRAVQWLDDTIRGIVKL